MKFEGVWRRACSVGRLNFVILLFLLSCDNYIIERASSDYFPIEEGNWWHYVRDSDTLIAEVEPLDTILQIECFPITFGGYLKYWSEDYGSISEYINIIYNFSGDDYTIIEDFIVRIELPLIDGNTWEDSLVDSLNISGEWIHAKYNISGRVSGFSYSENFDGDVYTIELNTIESLISPDTTIIDSNYVVEDYAPDIGLVRFENGDGEYTLIDYELQ